jgi:hypothetical protein
MSIACFVNLPPSSQKYEIYSVLMTQAGKEEEMIARDCFDALGPSGQLYHIKEALGDAFDEISEAIQEVEQSIPIIPTIVIDDNVIEFFGYPTTIADSQFEYTGVTQVQIGNSVTSIGSYAFASNSLTSVTIPNSVTTIGTGAFSDNSLTSVTIPNSVTTIGTGAFSDNSLTSVTIPNSVTTIGTGAFSNNSLTSVTIPNSVTSIGGYAFFSNSTLATVNCYIAKTIIDAATNIFQTTANPLTIHARAIDGTWTAGTGLSIGGNTNVTVIKDL